MRLSFAAAALLAAAPLFAANAADFTAEGQSYHYTAMRGKDGAVKLVGEVVSSHKPFQLTVRDRKVSGMMGDSTVAFNVSKETRAKLDAELGSPTQTAAVAGAGATASGE